MPKQKIAMLTAGGLAPCLSSAIAELIERYTELVPDVEMIGYLGGYRGLLQGRVGRGHDGRARRRARCCNNTAARRSATAASNSPTSPTR